jgi:hypothetical protein
MATETLALDTFLKLVNSYGLPLILLFLLGKWLKPKVDKAFEVAMRLDESEERRRKYPLRMLKVMDINEQVMDMLRAILVEFECSRITIFSYHNGGHNITGLDFARCSCTHEAVSLGTIPIQPLYQALPVTMFGSFNKRVITGEGVRCVSIDCFKETDTSTYETLKLQNIKSVYCAGLYAHNGIPIGFMMLDYCSEEKELSADEWSDLKDLAARVATLLCMCNSLCKIEEC